jgi:hypothetical protein
MRQPAGGSRWIASSLALLAMTAQFLDLANLEITRRRHETPSAKSAKSADRNSRVYPQISQINAD